VICCGAAHGKVRNMNNAAGLAIDKAGPSIAVQVGSGPLAGMCRPR
jgi:hypothetical protein